MDSGTKFNCTRCGACCRHLEQFFGQYAELDRGDGVCRYYDAGQKLCSIYESRPQKCRIDESYELLYKDAMSRQQYYSLTEEGCRKLQGLDGKNTQI